MAEAWLNEFRRRIRGAKRGPRAGNSIRPWSSDAEVGIDISQKGTQAVFDVWKSVSSSAYVAPSVMSRVRKSVRSFPVRRRACTGFPDLRLTGRTPRTGRGAEIATDRGNRSVLHEVCAAPRGKSGANPARDCPDAEGSTRLYTTSVRRGDLPSGR